MDVEDAVVIETYSDESFAEAAVSLLEAEGIEALIASDDAGHSLPNLDFARGVRLLVAPSDAKRAKLLLETSGDVPGA